MQTNTVFYVQIPNGENWNVSVSPNCVIEGIPVNQLDEKLPTWLKNGWVKPEEYIKIVNPKDFEWGPFIRIIAWQKCEGPARKLEFDEYVNLYRTLNPNYPLPKNWKVHQSKL